MDVFGSVWEGILHAVKEWDQAVMEGKLILETKAQEIDGCLEKLSQVIVKLKWFEHNAEDFLLKKDQERAFVVLKVLEKLLSMYKLEFDLKASISSQFYGGVEKRRLLAYTWVMQPHLDEQFVESLPKRLQKGKFN